ncbi:MAG: hypothetical protein M1831_000649 [Alyxoria varia]|nr:MAG: hypothetical protein M1831_000649 [Alyxoria varia]
MDKTSTSPKRHRPSTQQAAKKLHFHALQNSYDKLGGAQRHQNHIRDLSRGHSPISHHPGQAIAEKISSRTHGSGHSSAAESRSESDAPQPAAETEAAPVKLPEKRIKAIDVRKEKQKGAQRNRELRSSLNELSTIAQDSSKRLDDVYYSILEQVSGLKSTIFSLQELSSATSNMRQEFERDSSGLEEEINGQIANFNDFNPQEQAIADLEDRLDSAVKKRDALSDRLEQARKRVQAWEKREDEWQARTSLRLRIGWGCLASFIIVLMAAYFIKRISMSNGEAIFKPNITLSVPSMPRLSTANAKQEPPTECQEADPRLRILDEL